MRIKISASGCRRSLAITLISCMAFSANLLAQADSSAPSQPPGPFEPWRDVVKTMKWSDDDIRQIEKNKLLIRNEVFQQSFEPYLKGRLPVFITSDSIVNGYHVLYEESILRLERAQATRLPIVLRAIWAGLDSVDKNINGDAKLTAAAKRRARVVIGAALTLMGEQNVKTDPEVGTLITQEVDKITKAAAVEKPAWLGPPDPGFLAVDYARFQPRGFYARSPQLQQYFRAVSWLQAIPFRIDHDEELISILMIGNTVTSDHPHNDDARDLLSLYHSFLGNTDDPDLGAAMAAAQNHLRPIFPDDLETIRRTGLAGPAEGVGQINDQPELMPEETIEPAERSIRILPSYRSPDAVMFRYTTNPHRFKRALPTGLEVAALLGSSFATARLQADGGQELVKTIDACRTLLPGEKGEKSLYHEYLNCLAALLIPPEKDVPALFGSDIWQTKSCQTVLGGWAQSRHTWILQEKQNITLWGEPKGRSGFVEPTPEFFSRLAGLVQRTSAELSSAGAFEPNVQVAACRLRTLADTLEKADLAHHGMRGLDKLDNARSDELSLIGRNYDMITAILGELPRDENEEARALAQAIPKLRMIVADLEKGLLPQDPKVRDALTEGEVDIEPLWRSLAMLCRRLESLSHKQLRGVPFNDEEEQLIKHYGRTLARFMLYGGESYEMPQDDAPKIADVFANPACGKVLNVGIGRPRAIYVLYPWQGQEILCRGAAMPYYELAHTQRLNDAQWKQMLDSPNCPSLPAWSQPLYSQTGKGAAHLPAQK